MAEEGGLSREALEGLDALLEEHAERYPDLEPVDVYVLLHESCCGAGVTRLDEHEAWSALQREAARATDEQGLQVREHEEVLEPLWSVRGLSRVHLRPYLRSGGSLSRLHAAHVATVRTVVPDLSLLKAALAHAQHRVGEGELDVGFGLDALRRACGEAAQAGYAALPHSSAYRELYAPSYRVVLVEALARG